MAATASLQRGVRHPNPTASGSANGLERLRHLTESQRAMVGSKLAKLPQGVRADSAIALSVPTQEQAAETLGVSVDSIKRARRVQDVGTPAKPPNHKSNASLKLARLIDSSYQSFSRSPAA